MEAGKDGKDGKHSRFLNTTLKLLRQPGGIDGATKQSCDAA